MSKNIVDKVIEILKKTGKECAVLTIEECGIELEILDSTEFMCEFHGDVRRKITESNSLESFDKAARKVMLQYENRNRKV